MKLLLDTNVLIDYYARRRPYYEDWTTIWAMQMFGDAELWVSAKSFTDVFCVLKKHVDPQMLQAAFVESMGRLHVCSIDGTDLIAAASAGWDDFEDSLVHRAALKVKADMIITRDKAGFSQSKVEVRSPGELIAYMRESRQIEYSCVSVQ